MPNVNSGLTVTSTAILQGGGDITMDGVTLGAYQGGVVMTFAQDTVFIDSDHVMGHIDAEKMNTTLQVSTELEQVTLENLAIGWGLHSSSVLSGTSSKTLDLVPGTSLEKAQLVFLGMSGTSRTQNRTFTLYDVIRVGSSGSTFYRGTKLVLPVTFEALMNSSGSYGTIVDTTIS